MSLGQEIQARGKDVVSNIERETRLRVWCGLFYEESTKKDWAKIWSDSFVICSVSPLHDRDVWDKEFDDEWGHHDIGDPKKPHRHVVFRFSGSKSFFQVWDILQLISLPVEERTGLSPEQIERIKNKKYTCPRPEIPRDIQGAVQYHIHRNDKDKAQYLQSDIIDINGFDSERYFRLNQEQEDIVFEALMDYISDNDITEYYDLLNCLRFSKFRASIYEDMFRYVRSHTIVVKEMVRSRRFMGAERIQLRHQAEIRERWQNIPTESKETKDFKDLMEGLQ